MSIPFHLQKIFLAHLWFIFIRLNLLNFFEQRATEYSKAATKGQWNDVWDSFDKRQTAKKGPAANVDLSEVRDMFSDSVAAE